MEGSEFDEREFFAAIGRARALLIGRSALVVLGVPIMTADYDFWLHADDFELFNGAAEPFGLHPNKSLEEAKRAGRYVLENDEHVDVLIARSVSTVDGVSLDFDDAWTRRQSIVVASGVAVAIPSFDDLILTKRVAPRPKDAEDIRTLEILRAKK